MCLLNVHLGDSYAVGFHSFIKIEMVSFAIDIASRTMVLDSCILCTQSVVEFLNRRTLYMSLHKKLLGHEKHWHRVLSFAAAAAADEEVCGTHQMYDTHE